MDGTEGATLHAGEGQRQRYQDRQVAGLEELPEELLLHVLSFLPATSLVRLSLVSSRWHALLNDATYGGPSK